MNDILTQIRDHARQGADTRVAFFAEQEAVIHDAGLAMARALARGNKILACGNGGSAADAQHFTGELLGRFTFDRPSLPGVALTVDTSALSAIANDYSYDEVFARQVRGLGNSGDLLLGISTSGSSPNVVRAFQAAREQEMITVGLSGKDGGLFPPLCDYLLNVKDAPTPVVQEVHIAVIHMLCRVVDYYLFENASALGDIRQRLPRQSQ